MPSFRVKALELDKPKCRQDLKRHYPLWFHLILYDINPL